MPKTKAKSFWFQTPWQHDKQHKYANFERNVKKIKEKKRIFLRKSLSEKDRLRHIFPLA